MTDSVTGIVGTVTARAEYLHGNPQIHIEYQAGKRACEMWIDESRATRV